jgi:hypothetical protein
MMKLLSPLMKTVILIGMALLLLGAKIIKMTPEQPVVPESPLSTTSGTKIKVYNFIDNRQGKLDPYMIGKKTAAFGTSMPGTLSYVYSDLPVYEIVTEAVKSELIRKGYKIVQGNEDFSVKGKIIQYWVTTPVRMPNWNVEGEVSLTMEVSRLGQKIINTLGHYNGRKVEHVKFMPTREIIKRVLEGALTEAIQAMSSDPNLTKELSKKQKN